MLNLILATAAFLPQGPGSSNSPVVINEFCYDDGATDNYEFVELYNRMSVPVDISGWKIVVNDSSSPGYGGAGAGPVPTHTIPAGTILAPGAFYLLGNAALVPTAVPGVSQQLPANSIENGGTYTAVDFESIELQDPNSVIVDSLVYEMGYAAPLFGPHPLEGHGFFGDLACGDSTGLPTHSVSRFIDGWDDDNNTTDFLVGTFPTPGSSNTRPAGLPYLNEFDAGIPGTSIPGWMAGFATPRFVDPTVADAQNPHPKPPSPQGGIAMSMWDRTGGGNTVYLDMAPVTHVAVETYVYLDPTMTPVNPAPYTPPPPMQAGFYNAADGETWFLGVRGSASGNANPPDISGSYHAEIAQGTGPRHHHVSGIAWVHHRTAASSRLYLVDLRDGASHSDPANFNVLAGPIDIVAGVNDGWQRVRLQVQGGTVVGTFGGNFGCDDGRRFVATTATTSPGQVYIGYRESVLHNTNGSAGCHPPLFDRLNVLQPPAPSPFHYAAFVFYRGEEMAQAPQANNGLTRAANSVTAAIGTAQEPGDIDNFFAAHPVAKVQVYEFLDGAVQQIGGSGSFFTSAAAAKAAVGTLSNSFPPGSMVLAHALCTAKDGLVALDVNADGSQRKLFLYCCVSDDASDSIPSCRGSAGPADSGDTCSQVQLPTTGTTRSHFSTQNNQPSWQQIVCDLLYCKVEMHAYFWDSFNDSGNLRTAVEALCDLTGGAMYRTWDSSTGPVVNPWRVAGVGCSDFHGTRLSMHHDGIPQVGETIQIGCRTSSALPYILGVGFQNTSISSYQLPLDLASFGASGCSLYTSWDVTDAFVLWSGMRSFPIPPVPGLVGLSLYWQGLQPDAHNNTLGIATSNLLKVTIAP